MIRVPKKNRKIIKAQKKGDTLRSILKRIKNVLELGTVVKIRIHGEEKEIWVTVPNYYYPRLLKHDKVPYGRNPVKPDEYPFVTESDTCELIINTSKGWKRTGFIIKYKIQYKK